MISPGRIGRVVTDTESQTSGYRARMSADTVPLPTAVGPARTVSRPPCGPPGPLRLSARPAGSTVSVYWGNAVTGTLLGTGAADATGALTAPIAFSVPAAATPGSYTITVMDDQTLYPVHKTFTVTP